ncbi:Cytochrome P450 [Macleaya cordata]|uniref:Cytochrome P450 n=1 Tax=Macleaya cordata TaxID=56857 RepID=A0A200Q2X8_MACCD|nr:Cytochrome P450 [Macleaya cordata]
MADLQSYSILFLIWLISTLLVRAIFSKFWPTIHRPPSPLALPIIGHLHLVGPIPHQALYKLSNRYGPLINIFLGSVPCLVANSADTAKEFLKTHELFFSSRPQSAAVHHLTYGSADFSFAPYGPYWKFMKKLCMSELLGGQTLENLSPIRREEIREFLHSIFRKSNSGEAVDVGRELVRLTNNIISRMTMSKRCSETENEAEEVRVLVQEVAELTGKFNLSDYIWFCRNLDLQGLGKRYKDLHRRFDEMVEKIIEKKEKKRLEKMGHGGDEQDSTTKDLLDILLDISEDENAEMRLTRENIKAFILDIFAAGTDTSAVTTEWALAELINNPIMFEKARGEIDSVVGKNRLVEESDIPKLPYLQAIVKETLRLHPTGPLIVRESTEDCKVQGYDIPAKTRLLVNVWAVGRDPKYWDNPLEFQPERFMNEDGSSRSSLDVRGQHFHLIPFGSGRRGCPGTTLAMQVVQTTLAGIIQCFEWKVSNGESLIADMTEGTGITLPRAHPLVCIPVARLNPLP